MNQKNIWKLRLQEWFQKRLRKDNELEKTNYEKKAMQERVQMWDARMRQSVECEGEEAFHFEFEAWIQNEQWWMQLNGEQREYWNQKIQKDWKALNRLKIAERMMNYQIEWGKVWWGLTGNEMKKIRPVERWIETSKEGIDLNDQWLWRRVIQEQGWQDKIEHWIKSLIKDKSLNRWSSSDWEEWLTWVQMTDSIRAREWLERLTLEGVLKTESWGRWLKEGYESPQEYQARLEHLLLRAMREFKVGNIEELVKSLHQESPLNKESYWISEQWLGRWARSLMSQDLQENPNRWEESRKTYMKWLNCLGEDVEVQKMYLKKIKEVKLQWEEMLKYEAENPYPLWGGLRQFEGTYEYWMAHRGPNWEAELEALELNGHFKTAFHPKTDCHLEHPPSVNRAKRL